MPCPTSGAAGTSVSSSRFFFRDLKSGLEAARSDGAQLDDKRVVMAMALAGIPMAVLSPGAQGPVSGPHGAPPLGAGPWIWGSCSSPPSSTVGVGVPPLSARQWTLGSCSGP
jgi:hypothetical protein